MGGMGELAPGVVLEPVPLLREVLDVVVADVAQAGVHRGHLGDVGGVDDHFAAVGAHRLGLVEALGAGPDVVVHLRHQGDDALEGLLDVGDVGERGDLRDRGPRRLGVAEGDGVQLLPAGDHVHGEAVLGGVHQFAGGVDQLPHGGDAEGADDAAGGDQGAHPVGHVDDVVHGATGEEVLVATGEAHHLVGEHRAHDQVHVGLHAQLVDLHAHGGVGQQSGGELADPLSGDLAQVRDLLGVVPGVVDDLPAGVGGGQSLALGAHQLLDVGLGHRGVGAQGDQRGHRGSAAGERLVDRAQHQRQRHGAGAVGNDHAHALAVDVGPGELLGHELADLLLGEHALGAAQQRGALGEALGDGLDGGHLRRRRRLAHSTSVRRGSGGHKHGRRVAMAGSSGAR